MSLRYQMVRINYDETHSCFQMRVFEENKNETRGIITKMVKIVSVFSLVIIVLTSFIQEALFASEDDRKIIVKDEKIVEEITFSHHAVLDKDGKFHLFWLPEENIITFEVQVIIIRWFSTLFLLCNIVDDIIKTNHYSINDFYGVNVGSYTWLCWTWILE